MSDSLKNAYLNPTAPASGAVNYRAPDLTRHPPRSPRVRLGGYAHLPRLIDKARAHAAGKNGDYHYNCPFDQRFFAFTGLAHEAFLSEVKAGKSDTELLAYVNQASQPKHQPCEIEAWSAWMDRLTPSSAEGRSYFTEVHRKNAPEREDIVTWFDWLDLDDYVTFAGKP